MVLSPPCGATVVDVVYFPHSRNMTQTVSERQVVATACRLLHVNELHYMGICV